MSDIRESFEEFYKETYVIRQGARGVASRHLERYKDEYISEHAAECYKVWCAAMKVKK